MLLRIVDAEIREGKEMALKSVYEDFVIKKLEDTDGCLFAGLLQSIDQTARFASLTLWESEKNLQEYTKDGSYQRNLERVKPYLESGSEWKIQLSKKDVLEYGPVKKSPVVKSYPVVSDKSMLSGQLSFYKSYLRVLSLNIKAGMEQEFRDIYTGKIQSDLEKIPGYRHSVLVDNTSHDNEMISITIWDDMESVKMYENEGAFKMLLKKLKHILDEMYQWKMSLEDQSVALGKTSSMDIDISKFTLVTGKNFT